MMWCALIAEDLERLLYGRCIGLGRGRRWNHLSLTCIKHSTGADAGLTYGIRVEIGTKSLEDVCTVE